MSEHSSWAKRILRRRAYEAGRWSSSDLVMTLIFCYRAKGNLQSALAVSPSRKASSGSIRSDFKAFLNLPSCAGCYYVQDELETMSDRRFGRHIPVRYLFN